MEQAAKEEEECGICLDVLTNPVALPCRHKFCSKCLNCWRSKYNIKKKPNEDEMDRKCPLCRHAIPPSKEMVAQLKCMQLSKRKMEAEGDIYSQSYMRTIIEIEKLEGEIGDWTETIDYSDEDKNCVVLPMDIWEAARDNDIRKVLDWLGPHPVDRQRLNARCSEIMDVTLVYSAVFSENSDLLSILLQLGAGVDPVDAAGMTPLSMCSINPDLYAQVRLLLEWGAEMSNCERYASTDEFIEVVPALKRGDSKLANLLKSEFGGRRCEVINLPNHPDLIGKICIVEKYLADKGRYKVMFEASGEVGLVGPENLKRRDRTPDDCGYYISYNKNGRTTRHDFASKEECQAFVSSLTEGDKMEGGGDTEAEARAEQAAASLLAELEIDSSADSDRRSKNGKKKGKKKGRK